MTCLSLFVIISEFVRQTNKSHTHRTHAHARTHATATATTIQLNLMQKRALPLWTFQLEHASETDQQASNTMHKSA